MTMNEKRQKRYPDTDYFHFHNANPKGKITCDCTVRAISTALQQDYTITLREMTESSLKCGYMVNDPRNEAHYLKSKGWVKMNMPKKNDGKKYTGIEFCKYIAKENINYIANIGAEHIVAVIGCKIIDTWNSSNRCVGTYWVKI